MEIYHTFFPGNIGKTFEDFLDLLHRRKVNRLTLVVSSPIPDILDIPFEMMRKEIQAEPVLLSYNDFHLVHTIETTLEQFQVSGLEPLAPPLRMLFVAALPVDLPEEQRLLELEKEQELLIEALGPLITDKKVVVEFLDIAALDEIEESLQEGEHHVVHFSGHGEHLDFSQQKSGVLYLEDEEGRTVKVTGKELAKRMKTYSSIRLVVLSACETAHSENYGVSGALINGGIPTVLGMRWEVSDEKATCFTSRFYSDTCTGKPLNHAMFNAPKAIYDDEKEKIAARQKNKTQSMVLLEWMIPFLYQNQDTLQLIDYSKKSTDTRYFFQKPVSLVQGGKYVGRGFIGRRREILKLYRLFREGKRSVCIHGQGGIGKTTLAIRFADNFENGAYKIIQFRSEISEETILTRLAKEASRYMGEEIIEMVQSPDFDSLYKLNVLIEQFLSRHKIIIFFDDFEENQRKPWRKKVYQREIRSPRLKAFLNHLCKNLECSSYILFTTRYLFTEPQVTPLNLGEMQFCDTFKMLSRYDKLVQLPNDRKRLVHENLGGHPHALGLLEKYIGIQGIRWESIIQKFQEIKNKELNHDLLLGMLWKQLTGDEQTALKGTSVFRDLTAPEGLMAVTGQSNEIVYQVMESLNSLSLLYLENEHFHIHRVTATFVQNNKMKKKQLLEYHRKAAEYLAGIRDEKGKKYIGNDIEARWHFLQAEEWDRAAEVTFKFDYFLRIRGYPQLSFEFLKEIEGKKLSEKNRSTVYHLLGMLYQDFGDYEQALEQYQKSLDISRKINDMESMANTLGEMGLIYKNIGIYKRALAYYKKSKEIAEKSNNTETVSATLHNIGTIYLLMGDYDAALEQYQQSLKIKKKIGDLKGISDILHQMGVVHQHKGDYNRALTLYQKAMKISEEIGDIKGVSSSLHQVGNIYSLKGNHDAALEQYEKNLEISDEIGDIKSVSSSLHQVGNIYSLKKNYDGALEQYEKSLEIKEKIGDIKGISDTLHQIGIVYQKKGDYDRALIYYQKAREMSQKIGDIKGAADSTCQVGKIYQFKGDYDAALNHYREGIQIYEKISYVEGTATTYGQMGILYAEKEDFLTALECSIRAFLIFSQIESPRAFQALKDILTVRAKVSDSEFKEILEKYEIPPDTFDGHQ